VRDEVLRAPHDPREVAYTQLPALAKGLGQREAGGIGECFSTLCGVNGLTFAQQSCAYGLGARGVYADQVAAVLSYGVRSNVC
jgi:hypothetical protein